MRSVGPNISDVTLKLFVKKNQRKTRRFLLPVLRHPNFTDKTADVRAEDLWVKVGNYRATHDGVVSSADLARVR